MSYRDNPLLAPRIVDTAPSYGRRRDESPRAYEAFKLYLQSESRRLSEVAERLVPKCSVPNVARWSSKYSWQARAWSFDKEEDRTQLEKEARDRAAARKRHLQISQEMQSIALHGLLEMRAKIAAGTALNMSPTEIENMMTEAIKIERHVLGVEADRSRYSEIRIFIGTHRYPTEEGYGQPEEYEEWTQKPTFDGTEDGDGDEPRKALSDGE